MYLSNYQIGSRSDLISCLRNNINVYQHDAVTSSCNCCDAIPNKLTRGI